MIFPKKSHKTNKNTSVSHAVALVDVFLHQHKQRCHKCSLERQMWINPPQKLVPKNAHHFLQFLCFKKYVLHLQMDYRSLVHEKDEAIYSEIKVIVLDIRGFYVSHRHPVQTHWSPQSQRENFSCSFVYLLPIGWALWRHQQEPGQGDQSERRGEALHVLKLGLEGEGGSDSTVISLRSVTCTSGSVLVFLLKHGRFALLLYVDTSVPTPGTEF